MSRSQEERKADTRQRLLDSAARLFATSGVDGVSVDTIADEAARTSGALYAHFGGKQGLVMALLDGWRNEAAARMAADFATTDDPETRLTSLWRHFTAPPDKQGSSWVLLEHELWLRAVRDPEVRARLRARYADTRRHLAMAFAGSPQHGESPCTTDHIPVLLLAMLLGLDMQRRLDPDSITDEMAIAALTSLLAATVETSAAATHETSAAATVESSTGEPHAHRTL